MNGKDYEEGRDLLKFMMVPSKEEERKCFEAFYDAISNDALQMEICVVCAHKKLAREGEQTSILLDQAVAEVLGATDDGMDRDGMTVLWNLLEVDEGSVTCWMCLDCMRALKRHMLPKLVLANNLWVGNIPPQLTLLMIPKQMLIAHHYPPSRCILILTLICQQTKCIGEWRET